MQTRLKILVLIWVAMVACQSFAATNDVAISLYNRWENLPSKQLMQMGERYRSITRQPDSALVCFSIVANRYYQGDQNREDVKYAIMAMTHITILYMQDYEDYQKALSYNFLAKELAQKHQQLDDMSFILVNEANIEGLINEYEKDENFEMNVLNLYKKAFYMAVQQKNWYIIYFSFIHMITNLPDKTSLIEKEMDVIKSLDAPESMTVLKYSQCYVDALWAWNSNMRDSAYRCCSKMFNIGEEIDNSPIDKAEAQFMTNDLLCFFYSEEKQYEKALDVLKSNEKIAQESLSTLQLTDTYKKLEQIYGLIGNQELASHYHTLYIENKVSIINKKKLGSAKDAKFLYELNKKNEEVREMAYRDQIKSRILLVALITAIVLLTLLVLLWVNNRRIKERNRQLYNKSLEMLRADEEKRELIEQLQSQNVSAEREPKSPYAPTETPQREGKLGEARQSELLHRVFMVMETSDEIYSPDFTLPRLAELVGDTRNNVSEAINMRYRDNFNGLINEYRIKEACRRFNDCANYGQLTIEAVGQSVGFKSRSAFSTIFKEITGITPGTYQRQSKDSVIK